MKLLYIGSKKSTLQAITIHPTFDVVQVENGFAAYLYLASHKSLGLEAILAETSIPGANSEELVKHLRNGNSTALPYILLNSKHSKQEAEYLLKQGVADAYNEAELDPLLLEKRIRFLVQHVGQTASSQQTISEYRMPLIKRISDIIVAGTALFLLSPLLILVAAAIRIESKGRVYYTSKRVGTGYKVFDFYKLRSMYTGADAKLKELAHLNQYSASTPTEVETECQECKRLGHPCSPILLVDGGEICERLYQKKKKEKLSSTFVKIKDDPRITRVGKFIRNTSIDELPQLINVIKGDMSIVGNRPLPLYEAELLTSDHWSLRFMAPAGITGLWQTQKRGGKGTMSEEERKGLDNQYALNYSFANDIKIILQTVPALLQKENV
jgi:lipopolysaccharide/colanic/teichoic acid biosynthesis glycosyltransferase